MRILYFGEIVGKAGVYCVKSALDDVKDEYRADLVIGNADGATGGFGVGKNHSVYLNKLGLELLTTGEQVYYKKDIVPHIDKAPYMVRAANFPPKNPGRGYRIITVGEAKVAVLNLLGLSGFSRVHLSNPYTFLPELVERIKPETSTIVLDYHATTTAEKRIMSEHADGLVTAVIGSGSRALTADVKVSSAGTASITDSGRTGSLTGVSGLEPSIEIEKFLTAVPHRSKDAWGELEIQGVVIEIDVSSGRAVSAELVRHSVPGPDHEEH